MNDIFRKLTRHLEWDERIIYPDMYEATPWMYEALKDVLYLVDYVKTPVGLSLVSQKGYFSRIDEFTVYDRFLLVQIRPGRLSGKQPSGDFYYAEELAKDPDRYVVLDTYAEVAMPSAPCGFDYIPLKVYRALPSSFKFISLAYLATLRNRDIDVEALL